MLNDLTAREISNRLSGNRTQLARHAGGPREAELLAARAELLRAREELPIRRRLEELDGRWENLILRAADAYTGRWTAGITAGRNAQAAKRARRGLPPLETVKQEARRYAERQILDLLNDRADEAWAITARAEIDEAETLRSRLERELD